MNTFEDLDVWKKSKVFVTQIYKQFLGCKDYSFRDQICRASVSIMNNIAEGFEKNGKKDFKKYLRISKGSAGEVRSMLYLSLDLKYIEDKSYLELYNQAIELSRMLSGFIKKLDS